MFISTNDIKPQKGYGIMILIKVAIFSIENVMAISKFRAPLCCKDDRLARPPFCSVWPTKPESFAFVLIGSAGKRERGKRVNELDQKQWFDINA